ncbi:adenylosuccinate synthase [Thermomicrobium sp. 4228-Ro]|uniref:adenylosuccinate synthase n=1 Tax=Thermomicrobium sp. 4228-Ro TaxID=2993937 RepID=UPI002248A989|nr:adenylosuccinate synthase [Thermomicrobium sp. 4228-Ro]MCX2726222.1 adenylosuccinate synthase [Thermomicrobium sp. 4228-Ro]
MPVAIVLGGQWGDEGKGKITDALAASADVVIRPNGSTNAGHTVVTDDGVFKLHVIPSGVLYPHCTCVIGAGVAVSPPDLLREIATLRERHSRLGQLYLSDRAHVIMPYHPLLDAYEEQRRGAAGIGTTLRGNGPAFTDKVARRGIRVADLLPGAEAFLRQKLEILLPEKNTLFVHLYGREPIDLEELLREARYWGEQLAPYVIAAEVFVQDAIAAGKRVIVEAAQGTMLDLDYGTYPYVTSSPPTAAGACQGAGIAPTQVDRVVGVFKAYTTRVGAGPFPTELHDDIGQLLRERGREYGTTTGRPRRVGWFDAVAARYTARLNGMTEAALTKLDMLDPLPEIRICTGYRLGNQLLSAPPARIDLYETIEPVYETLPGWRSDTSHAASFSELPLEARRYVERIEELIGVPITMIGIGPARRQIVWRHAEALA